MQQAVGQTHQHVPSPTCQDRRGPAQFSCGIDLRRALVVKESLKEGEKEPMITMEAKSTAKKKSKVKAEQMAARVASHPFLSGMNHTQLALLTDCAIPVHFEKGRIIFRQGETANRFYLIECGKVALESTDEHGNPVVIDMIGPGDLLGWSWMFPPYIWRFTARAIEPSSLIFFYGTILREYCERDHSLGYELFKRMAPVMIKRMQAARTQMLAMHVGGDKLKPAVLQSPFLDQELDIPNMENDEEAKAT
jgi:CRP-like cAMP-binding protein